jgi:hypothetical protein
MDTCLTLSRRVLSHPGILGLLLQADEEHSEKNVFNSWTKLQVLVQRARTERHIEWVFHGVLHGQIGVKSMLIRSTYEQEKSIIDNTVYVPCHLRFDGWKTGYLTPDMVTWRGLKDSLNGKGTVDMLIAMLDFKEHIFNKVVPHLFQIDQ